VKVRVLSSAQINPDQNWSGFFISTLNKHYF